MASESDSNIPKKKSKESVKKILGNSKRRALQKKRLEDLREMKPNDHYYSANPNSEAVYDSYDIEINSKKYTVLTVSGVFGKTKLDKGSSLIINSITLRDEDVLDLGCGTGACLGLR